jgi:putative DNA primase/helicase
MWALEGLKMVLENDQILVPDSVEAAKERFREFTSPILLFINECCLLGDKYFAAKPDLWNAYKEWFEEGGNKKKYQLSKKSFYEHMKLNLVLSDKRVETKNCWVGVGLKTADDANQCELPGDF